MNVSSIKFNGGDKLHRIIRRAFEYQWRGGEENTGWVVGTDFQKGNCKLAMKKTLGSCVPLLFARRSRAWYGMEKRENNKKKKKARSRRIEESTRTMRSGVEVAVTDDRRHEDR